MRKHVLLLFLAGLLNAGVVLTLEAADLDGRGDKRLGAGWLLGEPTALDMTPRIGQPAVLNDAGREWFDRQNNLDGQGNKGLGAGLALAEPSTLNMKSRIEQPPVLDATVGGLVEAQNNLEGRGDKKVGAGLMLGEPTALNMKYWFDQHSALDAAVGVSFEGEDNLEFHADYLYHFFDVINVPEGRLPIYVGGGLRYKVRDHQDDQFGFRAVAGLDYIFENAPVDVFFEVGPVFNVTPDFDADFTIAVGARFWFP